jgi:selenide,water dikinase
MLQETTQKAKQMLQIPLTKDLVLIGGGHTHALVLNMWAMKPLAGVRLTVITPDAQAPYSGMLPGFIAGHYPRQALDIDLVQLAQRAGATVVFGAACSVDPAARQVHVQDGDHLRQISYDALSINVGIHSAMPDLPGFADHAVAAKPLDHYARQWAGFMARAKTAGGTQRVCVIGSGVAGCELALASAHALRAVGANPQVTVIEAGPQITGLRSLGRARLMRAMAKAGIALRLNTGATQIQKGRVVTDSGQNIDADFILGAAGARAHGWLADLPFDQTNGTLNVGADLQIVGHPMHFAAGDCAYLTHAPRPKAGVFAVRAAPVLFHNLRGALMGKPLRPFRPQRDYLKLISLGDKRAMAEKFGLVFSGAALWRLKNHIDQKFMCKFSDAPDMPIPDLPQDRAIGVDQILAQTGAALCGACGGKVAPGALGDALQCLPQNGREDILTGPGDDAAILRHGDGYQVITTDHLRGFWDDLAVMTEITCLHALGDIWAMGAAPQAGLLNVTLPRMDTALQQRSMAQITTMAASVLAASGAELVGGHSTMGAELTIGLTITGLKDSPPITQAGARPGDAIILTRPIGTGVILAAQMRGQAPGGAMKHLLTQLRRPNADAAQVLAGAHAMTDVTGFGLAGHLQAICRASGCGAQIDLDTIPIWPGALDLLQNGIQSSLFAANRAHAPIIGAKAGKADLLFDPQTAGGFLAAVSAQDADDLIAQLRALGHQANVIGHFTDNAEQIALTQ